MVGLLDRAVAFFEWSLQSSDVGGTRRNVDRSSPQLCSGAGLVLLLSAFKCCWVFSPRGCSFFCCTVSSLLWQLIGAHATWRSIPLAETTLLALVT